MCSVDARSSQMALLGAGTAGHERLSYERLSSTIAPPAFGGLCLSRIS